jgi:hypothetical protein
VYFNFTTKNNSQNRKKNYNVDDESDEYGSALNLSKNKFPVESSCNSNNDDFEEIVG